MKVYFLPLACSLATRITLSELERSADFIHVNALTKEADDGVNLRTLNPLGLVPTLRLESGEVLTENTAVLWHLAKGTPLAPEAKELQILRWIGFIGTELHQGVFSLLFDPASPEEARDFALKKCATRLAHLETHLQDREFVAGAFSIADAYLITILNWVQATPIDLAPFPSVQAYLERGLARQSVKDALAIELPMYLEERKALASA